MSVVMDSTIGQDSGPVTPTHRARSNTMLTNPYNAEMLRYPAHHHYGGYADSRSGSQTNEEGDDSNVIYVSGIISTVEDNALYELFGQFGPILNVVRRPVGFETKPGGVQQYAFVRFGNAEDAQLALQAAEIILDGRKLIIKPRERRPRRYFSNENSEYRPKYGDGSEKILNTLHRAGNPDSRMEQPFEQQYQEQAAVQSCTPAVTDEQAVGCDPNAAHGSGVRSPEEGVDASRAPMFMSKALFVAGLPFDMSPKELFLLFAEQGPVEGCYIFPFLDPYGRRFGHIVMASFFAAQKAQETFDRCNIRNCVLEVGYRHLEPVIHGLEFAHQHGNFQGPHTPHFPVYCPTAAPHQSWPHHPYMGPPPGLATPMMAFNQQYVPYSPGSLPAVQHPYGHQSMHMMASAGIEQPFIQYGTPPNSPPLQSHPFGWQAQGRAVNRPLQSGGVRSFQRRPSYRATTSFVPAEASPEEVNGESHIRSISNSSSSTLVSAVYDKPAQGPLIVNGTHPGARYNMYRDKMEASPSDKQSTPSPVVVRSVPDVPQEVETPTKSFAKPPFEIVIPEGVPETPKPADPANLFVKNFDDDIVSDPDDLKKLFESFGPVASAHLAMIPGTNRNIGYGFVAFAKADDAANAKSQLNGSMVGKKRLFVSYAERKEERTQRLRLHFTRGQGANRSDGKEGDDSTQSDAGQSRPSDTGDEGSIGSAGNADYEETITREPPSLHAEGSPKSLHTSSGKVGDELPEASQPVARMNGNEGEALPSLLAEQKPALVTGDNAQHIVTEQEITVTTRWRGRTQLTGITEVEEEEGIVPGSSPAANTNTAYVEPAILQSHEQTFNAVSGSVLSSSFQEQSKEYRPQTEPIPSDAPRTTNFHRHQHYDNRSPSPHNGNRGHGGGHFYNYNRDGNGNGRGYFRYNNQNGGFGRGNARFSTNNRGSGNGGHHQGSNAPSGPRVAFFNGGSQPFNAEGSHEIGVQGQQNRKKKWQHANRNGRGGHQQRSGGSTIDHHAVPNMMRDVKDTAKGAVAAY